MIDAPPTAIPSPAQRTGAVQARIGVVIGSIREGRFGTRPAQWIHDIAKQRSDICVELIDLRDYPMPIFSEALSPAWGPVQNVHAQRWGAKLASLDALLAVTPEYNHGPSAVLKNALDYAYKEFARKPIAFVGYGSVGAARAVEQLRLVAVELQMAPIRHAVHIGLIEFMGLLQQGKSFEDYPYLGAAAQTMLDDLTWWTLALKKARDEASTRGEGSR
jgi:NAD(P)H-dependent FMN reductase